MVPTEKNLIENKTSIATTKKSLTNANDTFVIRRCLSSIKRIRQLLFTINYIIIHENIQDHMSFFELFHEYNLEVFRILIDRLERTQFNKK